VITRGIACIKAVEKYSAPVLVALALALLVFFVSAAGGLGPMLSAPSRLDSPAAFWAVFLPSLTAQVGYWGTLALNVSDFSRWAWRGGLRRRAGFCSVLLLCGLGKAGGR
jgi:NCS1 family nucleobase:cation symporter-1